MQLLSSTASISRLARAVLARCWPAAPPLIEFPLMETGCRAASDYASLRGPIRRMSRCLTAIASRHAGPEPPPAPWIGADACHTAWLCNFASFPLLPFRRIAASPLTIIKFSQRGTGRRTSASCPTNLGYCRRDLPCYHQYRQFRQLRWSRCRASAVLRCAGNRCFARRLSIRR
jgi:hypothetical protein